jgi:hypothetical protein
MVSTGPTTGTGSAVRGPAISTLSLITARFHLEDGNLEGVAGFRRIKSTAAIMWKYDRQHQVITA